MKSRLAHLLRPAARRIVALRRNVKLSISILLDLAVAYGAASFGISVYRLLCSCALTPEETNGLPIALALGCVAIFFGTGLYRPMLRYRNATIIFPVLLSTSVAALVVGAGLDMLVEQPTVGPMVGLLWLGSVGLMLGWRLIGGTFLALANRQSVFRQTAVAIYGAGRAGAALAEAMQRDDGMLVRCFLDDDRQLHGRTLNRLKVYSPKAVGRLVGRGELDMVVLAMPSASPARRAAIINDLAQFQVKVETAPALEEILSGRRELTDLRAVTPEELLSREPVERDHALVAGELAEKCVMVTGGGGSIGSALCRVVLDHAPRKLVIFEQSEFALYKLEMELRKIIEKQGLPTQLEAILGTVLDAAEVERAITAHKVEIIYHAAAYKHVPLVEMNPIAGANNNVIGTYNVADAARQRAREMVNSFSL